MNKILRISLFSLLAMLSSTIYAETEKFVFTGDEAYGMTLLSGSTQDYNPDPYECKEGNVTLTAQPLVHMIITEGHGQAHQTASTSHVVLHPVSTQ